MRSGRALRVLAGGVLALLVNVVLDVALDPPLLARWAAVVAVVLAADLAVHAVRRRGAGPERTADASSGGGRPPRA